MNENRYNSLNAYLRNEYGEKIYKLALVGGTSCPNRDGTKGYGGCIFCGEGSASFAARSIDEAIARLKNKNTGNRYIAYFQSYTSTYKITSELKERFLEAARDARVAIVSIATRPDCLDEATLEMLRELKRIKPVWVELGLQTSHGETAELINRGYPLQVFEEAVKKLNALGAEIIVHLILGLPGESQEDIIETVRYINSQNIQGVKFQLLHILEHTRMAQMYREGQLRWPQTGNRYPLSLNEYADLVCKCLDNLRSDITVHRLTGDGIKRDLIEPKWSGDKKKVLNTITRRMEELNVMQGKYV